MENKKKNKKGSKKLHRKIIFGIKLPPVEPCGDDDHIKTNIDIDPAFYSMVEGRPIRSNNTISTYKQNIKNIALKRTLNGYLSDEILRIDREMASERLIFENASKHFDDYQNSFDKFLADDNNKTIAVMQKSDTLARDLANLTEEHKQVNYEMATLKSKLLYIDETLMILLSFEKFLHKASPILWQKSKHINLDLKHGEFFTMSNNIFEELHSDDIKQKLNALVPPRLYFKIPDQLLDIFELLEKQNLNYLLVTEELNLQKNKFLKAVQSLKKIMKLDLEFIEKKMAETENFIKWNEYRESELKEIFFNILENKMRYLISSETALQIHNYVEYAYQQLIALNDTNLTPMDMTLALETEYNNVMLDLSVFDLDVIKKIEKEIYEQEAQQMKKAKQASKLLKGVEKLNKRLKSSYEPPKRKTD